MPDFKSNMEIVQLIIGIIVIISIKVIVLKTIYNNIRIPKLNGDDLKYDEIKSVYNPLKKGKTPSISEINKLVKNVKKRILVYEVLHQFDRTDLLPEEYLTVKKLSESYLVNWLNMNEEFDSFPDEVEYYNTIELDSRKCIECFKFRTYEPHIFADRGLMNAYIGYKMLKVNAFFQPIFIVSQFKTKELSNEQMYQLFN